MKAKLNETLAKKESVLILVFTFIFNLILAYLLVFKVGFLFFDAVSRTTHAFYVFSNDASPHLAEIGFIWPPLPSLIQLPLALFKPLVAEGFAGNITTSFFAALTLVFLNLIFKRFRLSPPFRYCLLVLYQLNPMILLYSINGMSEVIFIFFIVGAVHYLLKWWDLGELRYLVFTALFMALLTMTRWDGFFFAAALGFIVASKFLQHREGFSKAEGALITLLFPTAYSAFLWMLMSWMIMGNPLHFMFGAYSNPEQIRFIVATQILAAKGHIFNTALVMSKNILQLFPFFALVSLAMVALFVAKRQRIYFNILLLSFFVLIFNGLMIYLGQSYGWLRFFLVIIPFSFLFVPLIFGTGYISPKLFQRLTVVVIFLLFASNASSLYAMVGNPETAPEEFALTSFFLRGRPLATFEVVSNKRDDEKVAAYIKKHIRRRQILVDNFMAFYVILRTGNPKLFIDTNDLDFREVLEDPVDKASFILVPNPGIRLGSIDRVNQKYPQLYQRGTDFTRLVKNFGRWKLYKIVNPIAKRKNKRDQVKEKHISVVAGKRYSSVLRSPEATGEVFGRVVSEAWQPIPGTVVRIDNTVIPTSLSGEFRFTLVYPGIYTIYYDAPGYIGQMQVVEAKAGTVAEPPTVVMSRLGEIFGQAIRAATRNAILGTAVRINNTIIPTNLRGEFRFTAVTQVYTIYYDAPGYKGQTQVIKVKGGQVTTPPIVILSR